jgi:septal ring factor EnvC (AmiA/AmiB activator)
MRDAAAIQADILATRSAITSTLKAQEQSLDTGQGRLSTKRANLTELRNLLSYYEAELSDADGSDVPISFERESV